MKKIRKYEVTITNGHGSRKEVLPGDKASTIKAHLETVDVSVEARFIGWDTPNFLSEGPEYPIDSFRFGGETFDSQYGGFRGYGYKYLRQTYADEIKKFDTEDQ